MRKILFAINSSLDGYCSHADMLGDSELLEYHTKLLRKADLFLCGRTMYQLMVPYWPDIAKSQSETEAENEYARVFDSLDKVVFSTTLKQVEGNAARILRENLEEEVLALKDRPGKDIIVGGVNLASQLSARGLIDEYYVIVQPLVVGQGPRILEMGKPPERLRLDLLDTETLQSGIVALHYRRHS